MSLGAAGQNAQLTGASSNRLTVNLSAGDPFVWGDYTFRLTVKNAGGAMATDTVTISVVNPNEQ